MANLKALREKIHNITDYSPELQKYKNQVDDLINDAYMYIWTDKRWTFATKEYNFKIYPDILPDRDVISPATEVNANVTKGSRSVTFSASIDRLQAEVWEGQVIEIQGWEYRISKVVTASNILLDIPFKGTTDTDDITWKIKHRYYDLPQDCIELLSLTLRDSPYPGATNAPGKIVGLIAATEEALQLTIDSTADYPEGYVWSPSYNVPAAHKIELDCIDNGASTGFTLGTYLEVCWAFVKDGKVGSLSEPATIAFAEKESAVTSSLSVKFLSWDDQVIAADTFQSFDTEPSQYEGYRKVIFWNANYNRTTGERLGLPVWKTFNSGGSTRNASTYLNVIKAEDTASTVTVSFANSIDPGNSTYIEYDGQHQRIRPFPRVDAWHVEVTQQASTGSYSKVYQDFLMELTARYYYKPKLLGFVTDTPEMPNEFHQLIVYKVLQDLFIKNGSTNDAMIYQRRIQDELKQLERRFTVRVDSFVQRQQMMFGNLVSFNYTALRKLS